MKKELIEQIEHIPMLPESISAIVDIYLMVEEYGMDEDIFEDSLNAVLNL